MRIQLPEDGTVNVYTPSGAVEGFISSSTSRPPLAEDESRADRAKVRARLREVAELLAKPVLTEGEEVRPERLWETKARGVTMKGEASPVALLEVAGSLRRYVHGLPVLGRASVHVGLAGAYEVAKWSLDWRSRDGDALTEAEVIGPDEAAKRILTEMRNRRPEASAPGGDIEPEQLTLGYLSMTRRYEQRVLHPAWVAKFRPKAPATLGVVVAVPASMKAFETIGFPGRFAANCHYFGGFIRQ
jgi:hypothetical protein